MGFGEKFIAWVAMCHHDITTRFILSNLTDIAKLKFSLRQGDPWAMLLYVLYIEPLLLRLAKELHGLKMAALNQVDEDFCDDINVVTEDEMDMLRADNIIKEFEAVSGAILNRSHKSKVMGLGGWVGRTDWVLPWIQTEEEMRGFGIIVLPFYADTIAANWDMLLKRLNDCLISWRSRLLLTLNLRADVLKIFATSKLWYWCQVLPLPHQYALKFEALIRSFLWRGHLEKLQIDEVKNDKLEGGLSLGCVQSKADALFARQSCRILEDKESSSYLHVKYWIGQILVDIFPDMARGAHSQVIPPYFRFMADRITVVVDSELVNVESLENAQAKVIYNDFTSTLPPPKVVFKFENLPFHLIWKRLQCKVMDENTKNIMFKMINNILPNRDRLYRMGKTLNNFCLNC